MVHSKFTSPADPTLKKKVQENGEVLCEIWKRRIKFLASQPNRGLIILAPAFNTQLWLLGCQPSKFRDEIAMAEKAYGLYLSLDSFASKNLGDQRCIRAPSGIGISDALKHVVDKKKLVAGSSIGAVMGEYANVCVKDAAKVFHRLTGQKVRLANQKSFFWPGEGYSKARFRSMHAFKKTAQKAKQLFSRRGKTN